MNNILYFIACLMFINIQAQQKKDISISHYFVAGKANIYGVNHSTVDYDVKVKASLKRKKKILSHVVHKIRAKDSTLLMTFDGLTPKSIRNIVFEYKYRPSKQNIPVVTTNTNTTQKNSRKTIVTQKSKKNKTKVVKTTENKIESKPPKINKDPKYNLQYITKYIDRGYEIVVTNKEPFPISIKFDFELHNLKNVNTPQTIYVIPPKSTDVTIATLQVIQLKKGYKFSYKTMSKQGDCTLSVYDKEYAYSLPYSKGEAYQVHQGYFGSRTHQKSRAIDFSMPIGTKIVAVREGLVVAIEEKNKKQCYSKKCAKYNNYIVILHPDGTFGEYAHLEQYGVEVEVGDTVVRGQHIGYSGNVGYTSGPHLHFVAYLQRFGNKETIPTKFMIGDGAKTSILQEKQTYQKRY